MTNTSGTPGTHRGQSVFDDPIGLATDLATELARTSRAYFATEHGKEVRKRLAAALMVAAPILGELPMLRRTALGRVLRFAGVSALVVKGAEWLRDWEPEPPPAAAR